MAEIQLTKDTFEKEVAQSQIPVLVDFWASWCGPCMMLAPTVAEIAEEYAGKVKVCKVNVDEEPELARQFRIMNIPTLLVFKGGEVVDKSVGLMPRAGLEDLVEKHLG